MKIKYQTQTVRQVEYCCKDMEQAETGKAIVFPIEPTRELSTPWIFGPHNSKLGGAGRPFAIKFCPFCGERITFSQEIKQ